MKLVEALKEVKLNRNQIKRLISIRDDTFLVIIPKEIALNTVLEDKKKYGIIGFEDVTTKINELSSKITLLRERILITNVSTILKEGYSLARLKLIIDEIRSELAQLMTLTSKAGGRRSLFDSRKLLSSDDEEREVSQLDIMELEKIIQDLETKKGILEAQLEKANASTELLRSLNQ